MKKEEKQDSKNEDKIVVKGEKRKLGASQGRSATVRDRVEQIFSRKLCVTKNS